MDGGDKGHHFLKLIHNLIARELEGKSRLCPESPDRQSDKKTTTELLWKRSLKREASLYKKKNKHK